MTSCRKESQSRALKPNLEHMARELVYPWGRRMKVYCSTYNIAWFTSYKQTASGVCFFLTWVDFKKASARSIAIYQVQEDLLFAQIINTPLEPIKIQLESSPG